MNIERGDIMEDRCPPLIDILSEIPDFRKAKGKRHPLSAILALACVAMMCGYKGYRAFIELSQSGVAIMAKNSWKPQVSLIRMVLVLPLSPLSSAMSM